MLTQCVDLLWIVSVFLVHKSSYNVNSSQCSMPRVLEGTSFFLWSVFFVKDYVGVNSRVHKNRSGFVQKYAHVMGLQVFFVDRFKSN